MTGLVEIPLIVSYRKEFLKPGVSIILKGSQRGKVTGSDGGYEIVIPDGDNTLIFSFVGFITQDVEVGNLSSLDIRLEVEQSSMKKSDLTGAVGQVYGDALAVRNTIHLSQALQSIIPGLRAIGVGLPHALTVATFGGTAEYVALCFKSIGHEVWYYYYVTITIFICLIMFVFMDDTMKSNRLDGEPHG